MSRITVLAVAALVAAGALSALAPPARAAHTYYDATIVAFDGVPLAATVFLPSIAANEDVPFVLMTHGWAGSRVATPTGRVLDLLDAGYGVLTWDSRGFGQSGGEVQLNSPDYEVRDVSRLVTYVADLPQAQLDAFRDPRVGMAGGSYAGGIQLLAAAFDERIDAIAPEITWNDLNEALAPGGVPKLYWTTLLLGAGQATSCSAGAGNNGYMRLPTTGCQTNDLARFYAMVHATGGVPDEVRGALAYRSPATYMERIDVPTLLIQGYPDTLFDVDQAVANYEGIRANGAPVKLWLYDGGHSPAEGPALPNTQGRLISPLVIRWMDAHLKGEPVDTGPEVEYFVGGVWRSAPGWPPATSTEGVTIHGVPALLQGPAAPPAQSSFSFPLATAEAAMLVPGGASLRFNATGTAREGILFASLGVTRNGTTVRVDQQVQPVRFPLGLNTQTPVEMDLVDVAAALEPGDTLTLTLATTDPRYDGARQPGFLNLADLDIEWHAVTG